MIAALLLAGSCLRPPLFRTDGPVCTVPGECQCTESITWQPVPGAERYEIVRHNPGGSTTIVGRSKVHAPYVADDGRAWPAAPQTLWLFANDAPLPLEGQTYSYEVRACIGARCGPLSGLHGTTTSIAPPYDDLHAFPYSPARPPVKVN